MTLRYVGDGAALPGVPARDLTDDDLAAFALDADALVKTGLYTQSGAKKAAGPAQNKMVQPETENKER